MSNRVILFCPEDDILHQTTYYLQVIGQVVLLQCMCFKTMRGCVKVVIANATDEAFRLWKQT